MNDEDNTDNKKVFKGLSVVKKKGEDTESKKKDKIFIVDITDKEGVEKKYIGETFGLSLEFDGFLVVGYLDPRKPLNLIRLENIQLITIIEQDS